MNPKLLSNPIIKITGMQKPLTLVIDQGTHATRALVLDENGNVRFSSFCKIALKPCGSDRIEQDANEILSSVDAVVQAALSDPEVRKAGLVCAGLATQRSSVAAWDKHTGKPLAPVLSWQDRRVASWLKQFNCHADKIKQLTGLPVSPHYGAGKLRWYLDNISSVSRAQKEGRLAIGPLAAFILFHLLKKQPPVVDHANASRTLLWNIKTRNWDPWLLDLFKIPETILPVCRPICHDYGIIKAANIPITAVNGDQTAALYGLGNTKQNSAIINIGTGAFVLIPTGKNAMLHPALLTGLSNSKESHSEYTIEGTINGAGSALDWAADQWNMPDIVNSLSDWLMREESPPLFINTIGGLGSPFWQKGPPPHLVGTGEPWQKAVAVAESILFLIQINLQEMLNAGCTVDRIQVSGGLSRLDGLCRRLADLTQRPVYRPAETEATARGIAWLASGCSISWSKQIRGRIFKPQEDHSLSDRYKRFFKIVNPNEKEGVDHEQ